MYCFWDDSKSCCIIHHPKQSFNGKKSPLKFKSICRDSDPQSPNLYPFTKKATHQPPWDKAFGNQANICWLCGCKPQASQYKAKCIDPNETKRMVNHIGESLVYLRSRKQEFIYHLSLLSCILLYKQGQLNPITPHQVPMKFHTNLPPSIPCSKTPQRTISSHSSSICHLETGTTSVFFVPQWGTTVGLKFPISWEVPTLPETKRASLKMDGWKFNVLLENTIFCRCCFSFREGIFYYIHLFLSLATSRSLPVLGRGYPSVS